MWSWIRSKMTAVETLETAIENLEAAGYPVVMHTYDEVVCEVPESFGSVTELESLMTTLPAWAKDWPIKAAGGWEARNYRKG